MKKSSSNFRRRRAASSSVLPSGKCICWIAVLYGMSWARCMICSGEGLSDLTATSLQ